MTLGQIIILETIWKNETQNMGLSKEDLTNQLLKGGANRKNDIQFVHQLYQFAKTNFSTEQWEELHYLLAMLEDMRIIMHQKGAEHGMGMMANILWNTGNLFGTNYVDANELN